MVCLALLVRRRVIRPHVADQPLHVLQAEQVTRIQGPFENKRKYCKNTALNRT